MTLHDALLSVYQGRRDVYGRQTVSVTLNEATGAAEREARWVEVKEPLTPELVESHLAGRQTLGVYLLREDSSCAFVVWDIDTEDRAPVLLLRQVLSEWGVDALLTLSGSKGYHLTAAFSEPVAGRRAYQFARAVWLAAGKPEHVECFPKQGAITPERPYGNLIKLPLGIHRATSRRCVVLDDTFAPLIEGTEEPELEMLRRVKPDDLDALIGRAPADNNNHDIEGDRPPGVTSSGFVRVPYPCFADLATARYQTGERDALLFTLAKHLRQQGQPRVFAESVIAMQAERCIDENSRPAPFADWQAKVTNVYDHGYSSFGCETQPMARFCKGAICPIYQREHLDTAASVDSNGEPRPPEGRTVRLEDVLQHGWEKPVYDMTVCGQRIQGLSVEELQSWRRFTARVLGPLRFLPELPRVKGTRAEQVWHDLINAALESSTLLERPPDASEADEVTTAALDWLRHGTSEAKERSDVLKGATWTKDGHVYFRAQFVTQAIRGRVGAVNQRDLYDMLHRIGVEGVVMKIDGRAMWTWRVPTDVLQEKVSDAG